MGQSSSGELQKELLYAEDSDRLQPRCGLGKVRIVSISGHEVVKLSPGSLKKNIYAYKCEAVDEMSERGPGKVVQKTYKIIQNVYWFWW